MAVIICRKTLKLELIRMDCVHIMKDFMVLDENSHVIKRMCGHECVKFKLFIFKLIKAFRYTYDMIRQRNFIPTFVDFVNRITTSNNSEGMTIFFGFFNK